MNFVESVKGGIKNVTKFDGRASRSEYWYFVLFTVLVSFLAGFILGIVMTGSTPDQLQHATRSLKLIIDLTTFMLTLALGVRRAHDSGHPGWYYLIPFYGFVLMFYPSDPQDNQYGPAPATSGS